MILYQGASIDVNAFSAGRRPTWPRRLRNLRESPAVRSESKFEARASIDMYCFDLLRVVISPTMHLPPRRINVRTCEIRLVVVALSSPRSSPRSAAQRPPHPAAIRPSHEHPPAIRFWDRTRSMTSTRSPPPAPPSTESNTAGSRSPPPPQEVGQIRALGFQAVEVVPPPLTVVGPTAPQRVPVGRTPDTTITREMVAEINTLVASKPAIAQKLGLGTSYEGRDMPSDQDLRQCGHRRSRAGDPVQRPPARS